MTAPDRPRFRPYTWNRGKRDEQPGAQIRVGSHTVFIPRPHLRRIADELHDLADQLDGAEQ